MRIALSRKNLLGFKSNAPDLAVPVIAAKVGHKDTIGISVASASAVAPVETGRVRLTYPATTDR